jgi:ParB/RepB/Spo0J family partition protein
MSKRAHIDPLQRISSDGFIGYVEQDESVEGQVVELPIEDILDSRYQTREPETEMGEEDAERYQLLVHAIRENGFQPPLLVQRHPELVNKYFLPAGGHGRRDAAKEAGLTRIPAIIVEYSNEQVGLATAQENLARRDLTPIAEGLLYQLLMQDNRWTQEELAEKLNRQNRGRIKDCLALLKYAEDIKAMVKKRKGNSGLRAAGYLHRLDDSKYQLAPEEAVRLRHPIIEQFLTSTISTEGVKIAIDMIIAKILEQQEQRLHTENTTQAEIETTTDSVSTQQVANETERTGQIKVVFQRFTRYERLIGERAPTQTEREMWQQLLGRIQSILSRE